MKAKLTITIDRELLPEAKRYARSRGVSLSSLIEDALRGMTRPEDSKTFVDRWRGAMTWAAKDDERYEALVEKYGLGR